MPILSDRAKPIFDLYDADRNAEALEILQQLPGDQQAQVLDEIDAFYQWQRGQGQ
jgi:hypothetical protein